jgi:hypothetical protein
MTDQYLIQRQQQKLGLAVKEEKKPKPISVKSVKRMAEERLYAKNKKEYLIEHIKCEVKGCNIVSMDIHHKKGRVGKLLYNKKFFMAVCRNHHTEIESNPDWAIKKGYSLKRLNNDTL